MKIRLMPRRIFLLLGLLFLLDIVGASALAAFQLNQASDSLAGAARSLRRGDIDAASASVTAAGDAAGAARWFTQHPGFAVLGWLPGLDRDADALRDLIEVSRLGSALAETFVADLRRLGAGPEGNDQDSGDGPGADATTGADGSGDEGLASVIYDDGAIDLDAVDEIAAIAAALDDMVGGARALLADDRAVTLPPLGRAVERARSRLDSLAQVAEDAGTLAELLPSFVGRDEPRRYLLALQSPSEARGGGGLIGVHGLLSAIDGRISLTEVGPIEDLGPRVARPVDAPREFAETYGPLSSLNDWRQANLSPNFPDTSEVLLNLYERVRGERLDGVVAMDPIALGELTRGTGPIAAPGWNKEITSNSARRLLLFEIYRRFVHQERKQNAYLRALVDELWSRIESADVDAVGLVEGFQAATRKHHIKIYSSDPDEQALLTDLGLTADPDTVDGHLQMAFNNNNSGNKLDFFLHRTQDISIELGSDGSARVTTSIELTNDLPKRGQRAVARAGVRTGLDFGHSRMSIHFLLPQGATGAHLTVDGERRRHFTGRDSGAPMVWDIIEIAPEATATVGVTYEIPADADADGRFLFTLWPQATARPDRYSLAVVGPDGHRTTRSGRLKTPVTVTMAL